MSASVSSAFFTRLQGDAVDMCELIDVELPGGKIFHWTTCNDPLTYTLSGTATKYTPFAGGTPNGIKESSDLAVSVIDFIMANTGSDIQNMLASNDFPMAVVKIGNVFTDTPDLGRMEQFQGKIGDFVYDRQNVQGQARNRWNSMNVQWPYYTYEDTCQWRFGSTGCGYNTASVTISIASIVVGSSTSLDVLLPAGTLSNSYANDRFVFGRATVTGGVNSGQIRTIRAHTGDLISFSHPLPINSMTSFTMDIWPGCRKRQIEDCTSLYNNAKNFLGFRKILIQEQAF